LSWTPHELDIQLKELLDRAPIKGSTHVQQYR
jgi:hypothetical protein